MWTRFSARERRRVREVPLRDGTKLVVRPASRQKAWIASFDNGRFFGRFRNLDAALGAARAHDRDLSSCEPRQIAHT